MTKNFLRPTPVFCTAIGAAFGFYFLSGYALSLIISYFSALAVIILIYTFILFIHRAGTIDFRFKPGRKLLLICQSIIMFFLGLLLGLSSDNAGRNIPYFAILPEKVTAIEGVLKEDPRLISGGRAMANVSLKKCASITTRENIRATADGEITVYFPEFSTGKLREFGRGTTVYCEGVLRNQGIDELTYSFSARTMFIVKPAPKIQQTRTNIRLKLTERTNGKEWGGLAIALLLGIKDNLDSDLADSYRKAGCSYILALSGMHLAVLAAIIAFLLKRILGLKLSAVAGAVIICLYCYLVGPMPSLTRAAIMYLLGVVAVLGFLPRQPLAILSLSFLIQLVITPAAGHSISFMLSYLALFGIFIVGPGLYELFAGKVPDFLMQPLSASLGAFIITAGITGSVFGYMAPVGIVIGLVLVPLTTLYMIFSMLWLLLGNIISYPLIFLYNLMEWIVSLAAKAPAVKAANPSVFIAASIILSIIIIFLEYKQRKSRLKLEAFK